MYISCVNVVVILQYINACAGSCAMPQVLTRVLFELSGGIDGSNPNFASAFASFVYACAPRLLCSVDACTVALASFLYRRCGQVV